ncbi:hypothetical protein O3P69_019674 [Scylla paramamosain]|uniref:Uncharacterized protein n=1 Tax=Scylla paramamosain TaxID=85552 RepID=A0AAW0SYN3_SCYPA
MAEKPPSPARKGGSRMYMDTASPVYGSSRMLAPSSSDTPERDAKIRIKIATYRDELSMGQCYMEFTTYTLFSKPDNFFTNFMRNKRSLPEEEELWEARVIGGSGGGGGDGGGGSAFERLAQGFISMLDSSPTTRQYASLLKQVLPVVVQMTAAQDSGERCPPTAYPPPQPPHDPPLSTRDPLNSPGESGVESIREVTRLSRLGRVDDILAEEVLSPYFCLKNYMVNKIWTLTERGVRSVVGRFDPSEQARMMVMWG